MFLSLIYSFYNIRFEIITFIYNKMLNQVNAERVLMLLILLSLIVRGKECLIC